MAPHRNRKSCELPTAGQPDKSEAGIWKPASPRSPIVRVESASFMAIPPTTAEGYGHYIGTHDDDVRRKRRRHRLSRVSRPLFPFSFRGSSSCRSGSSPDVHDKDTANSPIPTPTQVAQLVPHYASGAVPASTPGSPVKDLYRGPSSVLDEVFRAQVVGALLVDDYESVFDGLGPALRRCAAGFL